MTLSELLENKFRGDIRFRGAAYLEAERVSITRVTPEHLFGIVRDGSEYQTQLVRDGDHLRMYCNCANGNQPEVTCKHLWATVLTVDAGQYLTGPARPGYVPPFAADTTPLDFESDWQDDLLSEPTVSPKPPRSKLPEAPEFDAPPADAEDWEVRLAELEQKMDFGDLDSAPNAREREIFYEIDIEQSADLAQIVLQTSQRQRRSNGQWGKLKALKLRPGKLDEIEHEDDRRILAYLSGGAAERANWVAQQSKLQTAVHRYRIPHELCELIMPMMAATGRLMLRDDRDASPTVLEWDDGPAWDLCLRVVRVEEDGATQWQLHEYLRRGEQRMRVAEAALLTAGGLVVSGNSVGRLEDFDAFEWVALTRQGKPFCVDDGAERRLVDRLLDMPALPRLDLPDELKLEEVHADPVPLLLLHASKGTRWQQERLVGKVQFEYLGLNVPASSKRTAIVQRDEGRCIIRDRARETESWTQLESNGFRRLLDRRRGGNDVDIPARDLAAGVRSLIAAGWQVRADGNNVRQPAEMKFRVKSGIDWFELHADVDFEGQTIPFPELLSALARGDGSVRLDDGSLGILPEEWLKQYGLLSGLGTTDEDHVRFAANQIGILDALLTSQEHVDYDVAFLELRDKLKSFSGVEQHAEPQSFIGSLRTYQRQGLGWLKFLDEFRFGGCLADDMGLGKTVQVLALLLDHRQTHDSVPPALIVVPKSLMFNWEQEAHRFTPELKTLQYSGLDRAELRQDFDKYDIILTTYGTLRRDVLELKEFPFDYVILDEAQAIKNSSSQVAKASRLLQSRHRLALSGTPIENHLGDLWSIFEFLNPGMLGRSSIFKAYTSDSEDNKTRDVLSKALHPFILRRTKSQVASELPEKVEQTIFCEMGEEQQRLYDEMREHYRATLLGIVESKGLAKSKIHVLEALLRLRQAACHPALLDRSSERESSAKLDVLTPHVEELIDEGHKVLVFSQFTSMLSIVRTHFDEAGITYEYLDGQTRNRKARVEHFQNAPDVGAFLISLKAGGLGLNLTAADYVFLLDPWWNPAVETQAIDRAHRVGQTRQVFAYRLICKGTVEEKIAELQKKKRSLADAILQENASVMKDLSTDDLELLLS